MLSSAMDSAFEPLRGNVQIIRNDDDVRQGLEALLRLDPRLAPIVADAGPIPLRLREPGFAGLAHIIVSQMVSRASAEAIWRRMLPADGSLTAEGYALLHAEAWREFGLSRAKAETLSRIAEAVTSGRLDLSRLCLKPPGEALGELTALKGVGPWTAEVYLMFCGGHADVFPAGDVALQNAVGAAFGLAARPQAKTLAELSAVWSPWRSVAARLFWAYYATKMRRDMVPIG
ncbi:MULTISPECIES: DNA-3-methyladenine glycosylase family protein [Rhizobium]|uniref:DNA-3-methyladenine glycosylase family protein n=1 Tax=Rhizobium TaxID=379 RepID=UPI001C909DE1|nr:MULTISPECIES: DNA-3-methyladenine glycosylase [Rhizobium]MBY3051527.1 DNA-3-methyladenine glycosylase 2 family protein [Rhizobium laguerreae]MBY5579692.1 DNA-3-methyladenine glycosylase 2 family protein [Rhizobium leguminosarum]MBY5642769.1 DNA-3-methyladenine glycosylase 2 family protein [Rhizobium leguminosarum]MBY5761254.1 DNA-3-methyladenine glycosylase 2 family protein [Rhizobium leguminosarum]